MGIKNDLSPLMILLAGFCLSAPSGVSAAIEDPSDCPSGMVSYWTFDDPNDPGADDYGDNDGTLINGPVWTAGQVAGALMLDGVDDYVDTNGQDAFNFGTGDFTVALWMRPEIWGGYTPPLSNSVYAGRWDGFHFEHEVGTICGRDEMRFDVAGTISCSNMVLSPGGWYHVVGVRRAGKAFFYVDGILRSQRAAAGNVDVGRNLLFGRNPDDTYPRHFKGLIDDIAIYDRALTPQEVWRQYEDGLAGKGYCEGPLCGDGIVQGGQACDDANGAGGDGCSASCAVEPGYVCSGEPSSCVRDADGDGMPDSVDPCDDSQSPPACLPDSDGDGAPDRIDACDNFEAPDGLAAYWAFEEGSGLAFVDSMDNGLGVVHGAAFAEGRVGQALSLDGADDYADTGDKDALQVGTGDFTVSFWMKAAAWGGYTAPVSNSVYFRPWDGVHFEHEVGTHCRPNEMRFDVGGAISCSNMVPATGEWHHVVGVRRSGMAYFYINGELKDSRSAGRNVSVARELLIGRNPDDAYPRNFAGLIDEVAIFNVALSGEDVQRYYQDGLDGKGYCGKIPTGDQDGDGVLDEDDNCPATANPDQADSDADGQGDACDACPNDADNDADGDGVCGDVDNCPATANADQEDTDASGIGDACNEATDTDEDEYEEAFDNCPATPNSDQADGDADGMGNACDACPADPADDADEDGVCGDVDNCPASANADQADADGDGQGDACDPDVDGDGVPNASDACPAEDASGSDANADGCIDSLDDAAAVIEEL
ncbi:MAG: LamG-like jellyroll fold domain-containing protein, partial [Elusimicrobiota bacterium]